MESKVRKESQTLMEKTFNRYEEMGHIHKDNMSEMLKLMNPHLEYDPADLETYINIQDKSGSGKLDWVTFNNIAMHFLLRQAKHDHDQFIHKHHVGPEDFGDE